MSNFKPNTVHKTVQDVVNEYDLKHRGRELPGFSDYKVFEMVVQRLVIQLTGPAIETLRVIRGRFSPLDLQ